MKLFIVVMVFLAVSGLTLAQTVTAVSSNGTVKLRAQAKTAITDATKREAADAVKSQAEGAAIGGIVRTGATSIPVVGVVIAGGIGTAVSLFHKKDAMEVELPASAKFSISGTTATPALATIDPAGANHDVPATTQQAGNRVLLIPTAPMEPGQYAVVVGSKAFGFQVK